MSEQNISEERPLADDKLEAGDIMDRSPAMRKLDNFWYHYKWTVIVVAFFVVVGVVCLVQMLTKPRYDTSIAIGCHYRMNSEEYADFEALMQKICPEDFNKDGEIEINILIYQFYSEEEIAAAELAYEAESDHFAINSQYNTNEYNNFNQYTMTGETSVYIVSPTLYERLLKNERLLPLSDLYGSDLPVGTREDGCGIDLKSTDLYTYNPAMQVLPDTAILCFHRSTVGGKSSDEAAYEEEKAFFRALADYRVEE